MPTTESGIIVSQWRPGSEKCGHKRENEGASVTVTLYRPTLSQAVICDCHARSIIIYFVCLDSNPSPYNPPWSHRQSLILGPACCWPQNCDCYAGSQEWIIWPHNVLPAWADKDSALVSCRSCLDQVQGRHIMWVLTTANVSTEIVSGGYFFGNRRGEISLPTGSAPPGGPPRYGHHSPCLSEGELCP